jgi:hypothetical protein
MFFDDFSADLSGSRHGDDKIANLWLFGSKPKFFVAGKPISSVRASTHPTPKKNSRSMKLWLKCSM